MMKMPVRVLLFMIAVCLAGCGGDAPRQPTTEESTIVLGFSQLGSESAWRTGNTRSIQRAAESAGIQLMFNNAQQKQENQIKALRQFVAYQVDVITFAPIVEDGWDNVLSEAREAGIPVLLCDRYISTDDETLFAGFIGSDFVEEGRKAARYLKRRMEGGDTVRIVELTGTEGSSPMRGRAQGFREELHGHDEFQIIYSVSGDFLRSKGKEKMKHILEVCPDLDVLYSHNDSMTLGAIDAMEEMGVQPGKDVMIISVDGEQASIDALKAGKINCVVECTPLMGDKVMELAKQLAAGESIPRITYSEETVFSDYDDLSNIPPRGY